MNIWPGENKHAMTQCDHEVWNASHYPGTKQLCAKCDEPTGSCEDDSIYHEDCDGPICGDCHEALRVIAESNPIDQRAASAPPASSC